jgi:co-chaperonin GroES (HSP10)|tara:strand:- start:79 stop:525 length:447 start_codon:yes stop_codon:yes gene_type:complete
MPDTNKAEDLSECYVAEEDRVLDPTLASKEIIDRLPQPTGWRVLIAPFNPPKKSKGGILLNQKTLDEDAIQTNVGYVLRMGPLAYADKERYPTGPWCEEKQWVIFARYAGSRFRLNDEKRAAFGSEVRILNDDEILGTIIDPDDIYNG